MHLFKQGEPHQNPHQQVSRLGPLAKIASHAHAYTKQLAGEIILSHLAWAVNSHPGQTHGLDFPEGLGDLDEDERDQILLRRKGMDGRPGGNQDVHTRQEVRCSLHSALGIQGLPLDHLISSLQLLIELHQTNEHKVMEKQPCYRENIWEQTVYEHGGSPLAKLWSAQSLASDTWSLSFLRPSCSHQTPPKRPRFPYSPLCPSKPTHRKASNTITLSFT